jgi:hypothetical protein
MHVSIGLARASSAKNDISNYCALLFIGGQGSTVCTRVLWKVVRDRPDPALTSIPDTTLAHPAHSFSSAVGATVALKFGRWFTLVVRHQRPAGPKSPRGGHCGPQFRLLVHASRDLKYNNVRVFAFDNVLLRRVTRSTGQDVVCHYLDTRIGDGADGGLGNRRCYSRGKDGAVD